MKVFCFITTCSENFPFFEECLRSLYTNIESMKDSCEFRVAICDFGKGDEIKDYVESHYNGICLYLKNENGSMPANVNVGFDLCNKLGQDLFFYFNDDISLHQDFIRNAVNFIRDVPQIGFVGGASQIGGWNEPLDKINIPKPTSRASLLFDIKRLNWEFSACCIPIRVIKRVGDMDLLFGRIGLCSDNDYLLRIRKAGYLTVRHNGCTFWHAKAISQSRLRDPFQNPDPWRKRAVAYMKIKWGVDIDDDNIVDAAWDLPFAGKEVKVLDEDRFEIEGHIINMRKGYYL